MATNQTEIAQLSDAQLEEVKNLEAKLGVMLVAYNELPK